MQKRVAQALCGRAALPPLRACSRSACRSLFLAFLLVNMAWKGLGGFTQYRGRGCRSTFPRSDLILDPAALRGPEAERDRSPAPASRRVVEQAASAAVRRRAAANCSAMPARARSAEQLIADPDAARPASATLWLPVGSKVDVAAKDDGDAGDREAGSAATGQERAPPHCQHRLPHRIRRDRPVRGRHLGSAQGQLPDHHGDDGARLPDRRAGRALSRGIRAAEPLDRR